MPLHGELSSVHLGCLHGRNPDARNRSSERSATTGVGSRKIHNPLQIPTTPLLLLVSLRFEPLILCMMIHFVVISSVDELERTVDWSLEESTSASGFWASGSENGETCWPPCSNGHSLICSLHASTPRLPASPFRLQRSCSSPPGRQTSDHPSTDIGYSKLDSLYIPSHRSTGFIHNLVSAFQS